MEAGGIQEYQHRSRLALLKAIEQILVFFFLSRDRAAWFADQSESSQANRSVSRFHLGGLLPRRDGSACSSAFRFVSLM